MLFLIIGQHSFAEKTAKIYWYVNGEKQEWLIDNEVTAFKFKEIPKEFSWDKNIVKEAKFAEEEERILKLSFNEKTDNVQKTEVVKQIINQSAQPLLAIHLPGSDKNDLLYIDANVLISFNQRNVSKSFIEDFILRYDLEVVHEPEIGSTWIFRYKKFTEADNSATVSARIYEDLSADIAVAQPNRVNLFSPHSSNDSQIDMAWHLENNGQQISCSGIYGTHHADAHISDTWDLGYAGQGIKVGVIDFYGFDFDHPDMQGQFLSGWDCIKNTSYDATNFYYSNSGQAHGMAVAGIIGAKRNNGEGSAGVAYDAKIIPFLIDGSESAVIMAMQKAMSSSFDVDVINCSFGSYFASPAIEAEINNLVTAGRVRDGIARGIVVVASHGNDHYSDLSHPQYPSAYSKVISVASSTPDDKKKTPGDQWDISSAWGTNYGSLLSLAAPGVCIFTTDLSGADGYSSSDYVGFQKTSASAPIVSGVAALLLSKNPLLNWQDVLNILNQTADKVNATDNGGSYNYNYDTEKPGQSMEMGYGRINAFKAVTNSSVGIDDRISLEHYKIELSTLVNDQFEIRYNTMESAAEFKVSIYDASGKALYLKVLPKNTDVFSFDVSDLSNGMYLSRITSNDGNVIAAGKFVKVN